MRRIIAIFLGAGLCAPVALAEAPNAPIDPGRYAMTPAEGGFFRLDKQTGAVTFCAVKDGVAACRLGADERSALETEIARLRAENAELKAKAGVAGTEKPTASQEDEQFERALGYAERFMRRIMRLFREEAPAGERS